MFCYNCGKQIKDGILFCPNCGTRLEIPGKTDSNPDAEKKVPSVPAPAAENIRKKVVPKKAISKKEVSKKEPPVSSDMTGPTQFEGEGSFSLHSYLFYKTQLTITKRDLKLVVPNKPALAVIPTGSTSQTIPLRNIGNIVANRTINLKSIILGLVLVFFGLYVFSAGSGGLGAIVILLGLGTIFLEGFDSSLRIDYGSDSLVINAWPIEMGKIQQIRDVIQKALYYEADKTDMNLQMENYARAIGREFRDAMKD